MKTMLLLLFFSTNIYAQKTGMNSEYELQSDSIIIYAQEKKWDEFEGMEYHWHADYSHRCISKRSFFQFPFLMIYFSTDDPVSKIVVCKPTLLKHKEDMLLLLPGEYRVRSNDSYLYIVCKIEITSAYDSNPVLSTHVCYRPW